MSELSMLNLIYHFVCEKDSAKLISSKYVKMEEQLGDIFTNPRWAQMNYTYNKLGMIDIYVPT